MAAEMLWVEKRAILFLHDESLREHGGLQGLRDEGLLDSALARPQHLLHYNADATLGQLAAAYAVGVARNHPFADGNKRSAFLALDLFCRTNGWKVSASQAEIVSTMLGIAAGELTEEQLAAWIKQHLVPLVEPQP